MNLEWIFSTGLGEFLGWFMPPLIIIVLIRAWWQTKNDKGQQDH